MKRPILFSLVAMLAASSTAAVYFHRETLRLRQELQNAGWGPVATRAADDASPVVAADGKGVDPANASDAAAAARNPGEAGDEGRRAASRTQRGEDRRIRGQETMARMLTDPAMREAMLTRMKAQVDRQFGGLFVRLELNEDEAEVLRTLLAERQMARAQSNFLERSSGDDVHARLEAEKWQQREEATIEAGIAEVLGPDGMDILRDYQRTSGERQVVANISQRASYMGAPLDNATSEKLVDVIVRAAEDNPVSRNPAVPRRGDDGASLTPQEVNQYLGELQARNQAVLAEAQTFLATPQLEALAAQQLEAFEQVSAQLDFQLRNPDLATRGGGFRGPGGRGGGGPGGPR